MRQSKYCSPETQVLNVKNEQILCSSNSANSPEKVNGFEWNDILFLIVCILAIAGGCSKDERDCVPSEKEREEYLVSDIYAAIGDDAHETKMTFMEGTDPENHTVLQSKWSDSDAIVVTPNSVKASSAVVFNLVSGQGTGNGVFRGERDLNEMSQTWTVFYPSTIRSDADFEDFSFSDQVQNGNNNTDHLSGLNLMRKQFTYDTPQSMPTSISFSGEDFEQSSCIKFVLSDFPESIIPESLTMEVFNYATYYWSSLNQNVIVQTDFSQTLSFSNIQDTTALTAYMMVPPIEQTFNEGQYLRLSINGANGKKLVTERRLTHELTLDIGTYNTISLSKNWVIDTGIDGTWNILQASTADAANKYCNIIIMGDGYTYEDYLGTESNFARDVQNAYSAIFSIEPYKSLKDYFGVYCVNVVSGQKIHTTGSYLNGAQNVDTNSKLEVQFTPNETKVSGNEQRALYYAERISDLTTEQICRSAICVIANTYCHAGTCTIHYGYWETDYCEDYSIAYVSLGNNNSDRPENFRRCIIHEVGGHGFGKLADEYTKPQYYTNPANAWNNLISSQNRGIYPNVYKYVKDSTTLNDTPWANLSGVSSYSPEEIGLYEGAYAVLKDFCRSTPNSIMRESTAYSNADYFNAISRKQIYHRIMRLSGKTQQEAESGFLVWDAAHMPTSGPYAETKSDQHQTIRTDSGLLPLAEPILICHER